jgi:hypothetical protein
MAKIGFALLCLGMGIVMGDCGVDFQVASPPPLRPIPLALPTPPNQDEGGIGALVTQVLGHLEIPYLSPDGAGIKAGLLPGDWIIAVDGHEVHDVPETTRLVRGKIGTTVQLSIQRGNNPVRIFNIVRAEWTKSLPPGQPLLGRNIEPRGVDPAALAKVALPENPNREQVRDYIKGVFLASADQNQVCSTDPQVAMLEKIGSDNIDLLVDAKVDGLHLCAFYKTEAIVNLARDQDRDLILGHLTENPRLIQCVIKKGWQDAAKPILLTELRKHPGNFDRDWFNAIVDFKDPSTYTDLLSTYVGLWNMYAGFQKLKTLPDFDLKSAADAGWECQKKRPPPGLREDWNDYGMAAVGAAYGHHDALDYLFKVLAAHVEPPSGYQMPDVRSAIRDCVASTDLGEDWPAWYAKNGDQLSYDKNLQKFVLR